MLDTSLCFLQRATLLLFLLLLAYVAYEFVPLSLALLLLLLSHNHYTIHRRGLHPQPVAPVREYEHIIDLSLKTCLKLPFLSAY